MNETKKLSPRAALDAKTDELVADLQAIRAQVSSKKGSGASPADLADLQQRLFEVWVAEKLALNAGKLEQANHELQATKLELGELRKLLAVVQKEVVRLGKLAEKHSLKLSAKKPLGSGKNK